VYDCWKKKYSDKRDKRTGMLLEETNNILHAWAEVVEEFAGPYVSIQGPQGTEKCGWVCLGVCWRLYYFLQPMKTVSTFFFLFYT
jgi:hypothetical protein